MNKTVTYFRPRPRSYHRFVVLLILGLIGCSTADTSEVSGADLVSQEVSTDTGEPAIEPEPVQAPAPAIGPEPVPAPEVPEPVKGYAETDEPEPVQEPEPEPPVAAAEPVPGTIRVIDTNVSGGGFQSDVTITDDGQTVYSSADVSGVFKSTDGGLRFESRNQGLKSTKIASLAITPDNQQVIYAGTGDKGKSGGLFRSIDGGDSWTLTAAGANAQFAGNHSANNDPVPKGHPRSNGDLILVVNGENPDTFTDDIVVAGTYKNGVILFTEGGDVQVSAVNDAGFVRSVAGDPGLPNTLFAAIQFVDSTKNGIYKIDYSNLSAPVSTLVYRALRPEGLSVLSNGHVYGALGVDGIVKYDGMTWKLENSGLSINDNNRAWTAVSGYVMGSNDIIYAGTNNQGGSAKGANYSSVWRTENGGSSWSPLVDADTNVSDQVYGQSYDWWYRIDAFRQAGLGRTNSIVSSIDLSRGADLNSVTDDVIYISGRGGIWKSKNGGGLWEPTVYNMQATANNGVAVNPNNPDQIVLANTDYVVLETGNSFERSDLSRDKPAGSESRGYDVIFDAASNELILGVGDRDKNQGGEVFVKSATALGGTSGIDWTNTNLSSVTVASNGRVRAVSYGYHDGSVATSQTILAAVEGEGVYRRHNGVWSKSSGVNIGSTDRSNFIWPDNMNSGVVYLLDLSSGFHRSNDGGQSWSDVWPSMKFNNHDFFNTGYIAASDGNPTTLYLSIQGSNDSPIGTRFRVYRLTEANSRVFGPPGTPGIIDITTKLDGTSIRRPGPIVVSEEGHLWLTQQQDSQNGIEAALFFMQNPTADTAFMEITTDEYRNKVVSPSGIDVSSDGSIYIAQNGIGMVKIVRE